MYGTQYSDLCYGYNAFWSRHLRALAIDCPGFEVEALMGIRAAKAKLRIHEVPVTSAVGCTDRVTFGPSRMAGGFSR